MKRFLGALKKGSAPFLVWVVITVVLAVITIILGSKVNTWTNSLILASFVVLPVRSWTYRFFKKEAEDRKDQLGRFSKPHVIYLLVWAVALFAALVFLTFRETSRMIVRCVTYPVVHFNPIGMLLWAILTAAYVALAIWLVRQLRKEVSENTFQWKTSWWKVALIVGAFFIKLVVGELFLKFTGDMIGSMVALWAVVIGVPFCVYGIVKLISKLKSKSN